MPTISRRRLSLTMCLLLLSAGSFLGSGCTRKADAATVQSIQAAYDKQSAAYGIRDVAGVLSVCHPKYEEVTSDDILRRPEYDQMIQGVLSNSQSCSISSEIIEARMDGEQCRVTVNRRIQAAIYSTEDGQMHQIQGEEMNRDIWERAPGKGWLKRHSSVVGRNSGSGGAVIGIRGTIRTRTAPVRVRVRAPRLRLRR